MTVDDTVGVRYLSCPWYDHGHGPCHRGLRFRHSLCSLAAGNRRAKSRSLEMENDREFRCGTCGKYFSMKGNLSRYQTRSDCHFYQRPIPPNRAPSAFSQPPFQGVSQTGSIRQNQAFRNFRRDVKSESSGSYASGQLCSETGYTTCATTASAEPSMQQLLMRPTYCWTCSTRQDLSCHKCKCGHLAQQCSDRSLISVWHLDPSPKALHSSHTPNWFLS